MARPRATRPRATRPRVIRPLRNMRDVSPWRRRVTLGVLALVFLVFVVICWNFRAAAEHIAEAVRGWE